MTPCNAVHQWERLYAQAKAGDEDALGRLLNAFRPYLLWTAHGELDSDLIPKGGASDLVQDVMVNAFEGRDEFRGETYGEMLAWLRQILLNTASNFRRRYRQTDMRDVTREVPLELLDRTGVEPPATERAPDRELLTAEQARALEAALAALHPGDRELIVWRNLELLPFKDIAARRGVSEKRAQKHWARAIAALERQLAAPC